MYTTCEDLTPILSAVTASEKIAYASHTAKPTRCCCYMINERDTEAWFLQIVPGMYTGIDIVSGTH